MGGKPSKKVIRFFKPKMPKFEKVRKKIEDVFESGMLTTGENVAKFEEKIAKFLGADYALMTSSCSSGLFLIMMYRKEKVTIPALTFGSTLEAVYWAKHKVKAVDVDIQTGLLKPGRYNHVIGVHLYGQDCSVNIGPDAVFDAAHAFAPGAHRGIASVFSLGPTKQMTCGGEGGVITTNHELGYEQFKLRRNHGHAGDLKYITTGTNARPNEIQAIIALENLKSVRSELKNRENLYKRYISYINTGDYFPKDNILSIKDFVILLEPEQQKALNTSIPIKNYYPALTTSLCPNAEYIGLRATALPFHTELKLKEIKYVCEEVNKVLGY